MAKDEKKNAKKVKVPKEKVKKAPKVTRGVYDKRGK
tara:strand:- start:463 stop:570 length:108 start_codon:yes stop_codon:yes gene_type:complete